MFFLKAEYIKLIIYFDLKIFKLLFLSKIYLNKFYL